MSAYHHVKDGVKYPAVMLTHGVNDPRVECVMVPISDGLTLLRKR